MDDLFDAAAMYDEDYLYFFATPGERHRYFFATPGDGTEFAAHEPVVPGAGSPGAAPAELAWRLLDLQPGGRLAMDLDNLTSFLASYCPSRVVAAKENGDMLVDRYHLDALTGRFEAERTVIRSGQARRVNFVKRLFGFPELRDWLLAAGFNAVTGYGEDTRPLTADHSRMVIVAELP